MDVLSALGVAVAAFVLMEPLTALVHRAIMHGPGVGLHRSHHRHAARGEAHRWEANDLYPIAFAAVVMLGLGLGFNVEGFAVLVPIGVGVTAYGFAYALVHDVYTHRRLPLLGGRRIGWLERLADAHRVHHRHGGAPYGMLVPIRSRSGSRPSHDPDVR